MLSPLAPAPRHVPWSLQILNLFNAMSLFGWLFFGFGMIFFWVFAGNADLSILTFRGPYASAMGKVTQADSTNASEGGNRILEHRYEFTVDGKVYRGRSYTTGSSISAGETARIEYDPDDPSRSRIEGMRRNMFGPLVGLVAIFPLVGVGVILPATITGLRRNRLLREGVFATGKLVGKKATNVSVNNRRVYELRFEFVTRDGRRSYATARTSLTERLQDEEAEPLLYDPAEPSRAFMLDELPTRPSMINGELQGRPVAAFFASILPVFSVSVHALVLWIKIRF